MKRTGSDRFTARRLGLRRRRWFKVTVGVLAVLLVVGGVWLVRYSTVLDVRTVEVSGETTLKADQIREAAEVPVGDPMSRVDLQAIEERVQQLSRVRSAEVDRSWPHTVTISVVERTAVMWTREGGEIHGVDRFGIDYRTFDEEPKGLVEATIAATDAEARLDSVRELAEVAHLIRTQKPSWADDVRSISASTRDSVQVRLTEGRTVVWGSADQGERKLEVLQTLLDIDAKQYDVSAPDQPTTKD